MKRHYDLTNTEAHTILQLLWQAKDEGGYFGHKQQYYDRLDRLIVMFGGDLTAHPSVSSLRA